MIRFFRTIRQSLLAQGRITRYLTYAIGEIVLVVVGILIALQLNGLKEQRGRDAQERRILTEMLANLRSDSLDMAGNRDRNSRVLNASKAVLRQLEERIPWNDSMAHHYGSLGNWSVSLPVLSSYENLKSIGFDLITNDSLRSMMHRLYAQQYPFVIRMEQEYGGSVRNLMLQPELTRKTVTRSRREAEPLDLQALMDDHVFKETIRSSIMAQQAFVGFYTKTLELDVELMRMIKHELGKEQ
jgi:hypothetical protein